MESRRNINLFGGNEDPLQPKVTDFDMFLPWACNHLSIDTDVIVTRTTQETYVAAATPTKKGTSRRNMSTLKTARSTTDGEDSDEEAHSQIIEKIDEENAVRIKTLYDSNDNLVQIQFLQNKAIPRKAMQVIGLIITYYKHLASITINSGLHIDTIYEISKFLPHSNITELCFDGTVLTKANYHILLTHEKLKHFSLARCSINDVVVKTITDQLFGTLSPASRVLSALNLSSNRITDVGAKYIAGMLRTNRQLSYLNLAGNMITDEGGMSILDTLQKFPLEPQECFESRARFMAYLKKKHDFIEKMILELQTAKDKTTRRKSLWRGKLENNSLQNVREARLLQEKAVNLAETKMEPFNDHYSPHNTETQGGVVRCLGNNTLCYLNLAYNNLTYLSVKKLLDVLLEQKSLDRSPKGLIKVVIEGNLIPVSCKEYEEIKHLLGYLVTRPRRASTTKIKSVKLGARV